MGLYPHQIAEQLERQRRKQRDDRWAPTPLHAPSPQAPVRRPERPDQSSEPGSRVVIIDISGGTLPLG
jgi:hypothetical protein